MSGCHVRRIFCRIFSEKGLPRVEKEFPKLTFKGKGHEVSLNEEDFYH